MPSGDAYWLITAPLEGSGPHEVHSQVSHLLVGSSSSSSSSSQLIPASHLSPPISLPPLRVGTLSSLLSLSESLPKTEASTLSTLSKIRDALSSLLNDDPHALSQHLVVKEQSLDDYLLGGWSWNGAKYRVEGQPLEEVVAQLEREVQSIDQVTKSKVQGYNVAKGQLTQLQRRKNGNLSVRSLVDVVHKDDFVSQDSEFLETLLVAVPRTSVKDWLSKYERLTSMVVPRSSNKLAQDDEYALYNVTVFKKVRDEFVQKARENKFLIRDFHYTSDLAEKTRQELESTTQSEKDLWTELLRLCRTNFSEGYQALAHIKVLRAFVESVLRYGLPAEYWVAVVKPNRKRLSPLREGLSKHFQGLEGAGKLKSGGKDKSGGGGGAGGEVPGEYAQMLEEEQLPFVCVEVPQMRGDD